MRKNMDSKLKTFIDMNRQQLDAFAPSPALWQKIDAGMQQPALIKSNTSWLKYFAYGASAIAAAAGLSVLLRSEPATPPAPVTAISAASAPETPVQTAIPADTLIKETTKKTAAAAVAATPDISQTPAAPEKMYEIAAGYTPAAPEKPAAPTQPEAPQAPALAVGYSNSRSIGRDTKTDSLNVDTTFTGVTHFELSVSSSDVTVKP